jgi:hypothetical protein
MELKVIEALAKQIASETMSELKETAKKTGKQISFDDMEEATLQARKKFGEYMMQEMIKNIGTGKTEEKKTAQDAKVN